LASRLAFIARRRTSFVLLFLALGLVGSGIAAGQIRSRHVAAPVLQVFDVIAYGTN
jgi:hypothetical protein